MMRRVRLQWLRMIWRSCSAQADAFGAAMPSARVVRLANADHYVFLSNEADVLRAMDLFIVTLP